MLLHLAHAIAYVPCLVEDQAEALWLLDAIWLAIIWQVHIVNVEIIRLLGKRKMREIET